MVEYLIPFWWWERVSLRAKFAVRPPCLRRQRRLPLFMPHSLLGLISQGLTWVLAPTLGMWPRVEQSEHFMPRWHDWWMTNKMDDKAESRNPDREVGEGVLSSYWRAWRIGAVSNHLVSSWWGASGTEATQKQRGLRDKDPSVVFRSLNPTMPIWKGQ